MNNDDKKITKLEVATQEAHALMEQHHAALEDATQRLTAAKALLRQLDPAEQAKIQVNDTKLPELLSLQALAQEQYETSRKRFETNQKYLITMKEKQKASSSS
eukprot:scaffold4223_cov189-Amphora_coffeaeformis.AAC.18